MSKSREHILNKLQNNHSPFPMMTEVDTYLPMVKLQDTDPDSLLTRFKSEAEKLSCRVTLCDNENEAEKAILSTIANEKLVDCWTKENLPLKNLHHLLQSNEIKIESENEKIRIGITGVSAALAATGSIIITSGKGGHRSASLLPEIHIALLKKQQIFADFESWLKEQREKGKEDFIKPSNIVLISGPSRTADISMELVLGMHGPKELHIIIF